MLINHIGISGGKDSTALLLWAVYESGYDLNSLDVTFCNTHNEHQITYDYGIIPLTNVLRDAILRA